MRSRGRLGVPIVVGLLLLAGPALAQQSGLIVGGTGSGFIVSSDGYILTNEHVVRDATKITVYVGDKSYTATVVAVSEANDLALLKIPATGLTAVRLGNSLYVEVLEPVVAMGYPKAGYGRDLTSSTGEITAIRTNVPGREGKDTLQHNATITHGSSGGPLFNRRGEVIGVNFAGDPPLNFAIPINDAIPLLRSVPGFDLRSMGSATSTMTPSQIVATYRSAVVFIDCTMELPWHQLLPRRDTIPYLSIGRAITWGLCSDHTTSRARWLVEQRFSVVGSHGVSGMDGRWRYFVSVIGLSSSDQAARAAPVFLGRPLGTGFVYSGCNMEAFPIEWTVQLGEGTTKLYGIPAAYWISAFGGGAGAAIMGRLVFVVDSLLFEVYLLWEITAFPNLTIRYEYRAGAIREMEYGAERGVVVRGDDFARRLQEIAEYITTYIINVLNP